ncbi:MAG: sigma 54-interacting transcriptional regulator [Candidatus Binatia bacterium]
MDCVRVCVIDSSPAIRETIAIVLGSEYRVHGFTPQECLRQPPELSDADLFIVGDDALPAGVAALLPAARPVLWLQSEGRPQRSLANRSATLPRWFEPEKLRSSVQALLASVQAQPAFGFWSILEGPVLPREAAALVRRATGTALPVLICGEPGTGKARLARAIHTACSAGRFVTLSPASCTRAALQQAGALDAGDLTLFVQDVGRVNPEGQLLLLELLDCGGFGSDKGWHAVRLMCSTSQSLQDLARSQSLAKDLFYRLGVLPITLPPLRERPQDIPAIANRIAADLTRLLSADPVTFTERATERLTHYLWFGNLAELEAVLTRTIALKQSRTIDADDLLFGYGRIVPSEETVTRHPSRAPVRERAPDGTVDLIVNELAHEFKNPMVTIKTVTQHLERLLGDREGREAVARLTGEAVERMDRALENLLQFTRFRTPALRDVPFNALLAPALSDLAPELSGRRVTLDYRPPDPLPVFVDAAQIVYAFANLVRVISRDLQEGQTLAIHPAKTGTALTFEYAGGQHPVTAKLANLLDGVDASKDAVLPLGLVFAKTLIERNGGRIEIESAAEPASITVWLPSREELETGNGKATSLSC